MLILSAMLLVNPGPKPAPAASGVVVEKVDPGFEAARAGIQPGDVLISWERPANPPANPAPASGVFATPFDVLETQIDESPRARRLTVEYRRGGKRGSAVLLPYAWAVETRPSFSPGRLKTFETARRRIEDGEIEAGCELWRTLADDLAAGGDHLGAAWVWLRAANAQAEADRVVAALESFDLAIGQARAAVRTDVESQLWGTRGKTLVAANRFEEGMAALRQALALREPEGFDSLAVAYCLDQLVVDAGTADESAQTRALGIWKRLAPGSASEAASLTALARNARYRGDFRKAIEFQRQALTIHRRIDATGFAVASGVKGLCVFEAERHNLAEAEKHCSESLALASRFQGAEALNLSSATLLNLGQIAFDRGDLDRAWQLNLRALALREQAAGSESVGHPLARLGGVALARGDYVEAEDLLLRSEKLLNQTLSPNHPYRAVLKNMLAEVAYGRGDYRKSLALLRDAAALVALRAPEGVDAAWICNDMGLVLVRLGEVREAETQLRRALALRRRHSPASADTAQSSHDLGMLLWKAGRLTEAEAELRRAVEDLETQQSRLGGSEETRSAFSAKFADFYKDYLRLLMELGQEQNSFLLIERYRAGSFLRTLAQRDLVVSNDVPPDLERERSLTNEVYEDTQSELSQLDPATEASKIEESLTRLAELRDKQTEITDKIRKASPKYGALLYPQPLDLPATRAALDTGTLLLSYAVEVTGSFLFAVSADSNRSAPLSVFQIRAGDKDLRESIEAFRRLIRWGKPSPELFARARSLYDTLLRPAEALIDRSERLLIVPDGPLNTLPWAALARGGDVTRPKYLTESRPVHTVVSATVYAELKKARRAGSGAPVMQLAAFGDPLYPARALPSRLAMRSVGAGEDADEVYGDAEIDAVLRGGHRFEPLPESRQEVESIARLYAPRSEVFLGEDATEERARSIGSGIPLIHYACHAYVNERFPLDSALVFTIPEKPREGQDNGMLQAWEIIESVRIDADLVTLSACESGLGKEMGGEGLVGLTRAFQFAGARSVMASLWKVEDRATAELMKRFYGYLKQGKPKDEALRLAQVDLIRSPEYSQPKHWAAFQLSGDWK